jgi:hypothetical protein
VTTARVCGASARGWGTLSPWAALGKERGGEAFPPSLSIMATVEAGEVRLISVPGRVSNDSTHSPALRGRVASEAQATVN